MFFFSKLFFLLIWDFFFWNCQEIEEREKVVRHMWDVYGRSGGVRVPHFWREAFEAAYEFLVSDSAAVRNGAISDIAKLSLTRSLKPDSSLAQPNRR